MKVKVKVKRESGESGFLWEREIGDGNAQDEGLQLSC